MKRVLPGRTLFLNHYMRICCDTTAEVGKLNDKLKEELLKKANEMGAQRAEIFTLDQIVFDARTFLKCLFGCAGGMPYCPTKQDVANSLVYADIMKNYNWGIILCTEELKKGQNITLELESTAFLAGCHFAFGATECENCKSCGFNETGACANPKKVRPPLYALGIDVYSTVRNLGWELNVVQHKGDPAKNITAVFVE